ncbi:mycofactocin-coupled SDR family oxidoreductase [Williamsia sp.]|uniref:mycofactocin-coupled SDR family oxidoreductase n=1 Tax=Williamsia sp. TaxID=1872085 RepID=UPI002F95226F
MGKLDGKVAFITGAARGMGREHAIRLAESGADIIAVDLCGQIDTVAYPMSTPDDLEQTVKEVESRDRRIVYRQADVRDLEALRSVVQQGVSELGSVDIVIANAGIAPQGSPEPDIAQTFRDVVEVNLFGTWNTVQAAAPIMIEQGKGGSIVLISSTQGLSGVGGTGSGASSGYASSKHGVVGLMRSFTHWLAPHSIRVNSVHPTGVLTPMIVNDHMQTFLAENPDVAKGMQNLLPVPALETADIVNAVAWLVSDEARYLTGVTLPVDAGFSAR